MFYRASSVLIFLLLLITLGIARPPKKLHYDEPSIDSNFFFEPDRSPRPRADAVPQDAASLAKELACEPVVIRGFIQAWKATLNGTRNHGLAESGFAIQRYISSVSIQGWRDAAINDLLIPADGDTIAIAHVHGRGADEHPARMDVQSPVPNFVISHTALYVTIPGSSRFVLVRGGVDDANGWNKPCLSEAQTVKAQRKMARANDAYNLQTF
jgi:hypothetical protein